MAKKSKKKEDETKKVVAKCDNPNEVVANCDQLVDAVEVTSEDDVYLLGASVKDMGVGMCAVTKMQVSPETVLELLK